MTPLASHRAARPSRDEDMPEVDTTRKRGYDTQEDLNDELQNIDTPPSKRRRSTNWPLPAEPSLMALQPPDTHQRQVSSSSVRPSKFLEGSMNDKTSAKPPSVFTRLFQGNSESLSVDQLMADYEEDVNRPATARPPTARPHSRVSTSPTKKAQHTHNASVASVGTADSKRSGIYRFGRSIASSFNPATLWHKLQNSYKEAAEEVLEEEAAKNNDLDAQKTRAEQAYAELKAAGLLKPTKTFIRGASVGPVNTDAEAKQRDSGIEMDDARPSLDINNSLVLPPPSAASASSASEARKSPFHFKTPSLSNLKKARAEARLTSPSTPSFQSPDRAQFDVERTLRKAQSKKDLQKQQKLSKRVSDLESKLEQARRELNRTLGPTPPVPALPAHLAEVQTPNPRARSISPLKKSFKPGALPSLPSERLLFPDQISGKENVKRGDSVASATQDEESQAAAEAAAKLQESMLKGDIWTEDLETPVKPNGPEVAPKRKVTKKRKSGDRIDPRYKPESDASDDDEWAEAQSAKKRRSNPQTFQKLSPNSKAREKASPASKKQGGTGRLTKKNTTFERTASVVTAKVMGEDAIGTTESVSVTNIALNDEPSHPTATATPAHPRERSRSTNGNRLRRRESHRSLSPVDHARNGSPEVVVTAAPDGVDVPPMPNGVGRAREDDGWDGFGEEIF